MLPILINYNVLLLFQMDKINSRKNDLEDVFFTDIDDVTSQKIISQIEDEREIDSIKNV